MNKKGQISFIIYALVVVIVTGYLLYVFSPTVNSLRSELLDDINTKNPTGQPLEKLILYSLMPLLWIGWILLSAVVLAITVRTTSII